MKVKKKGLSVLALVSVTALTAAACGSSGGSKSASSAGSSSSGGSSTSGAPAATKTVLIGLSSILSGPAATAGKGTDAGIKAYMDVVNAKGGINGYKFSFLEKDNAYNPAQAATVARELVDANVFTVVTEGSNPLAATVPITNVQKIPVFAEAQGETTVVPPNPPYQYTYGMNPSYHGLAAQGAQFVLDTLHETKASVVDRGCPDSCGS